MSFEKYFTIEQLKMFLDNDDAYHELYKKEFSVALKGFLSNLRYHGILETTEGLEELGLTFLPAWNNFVNNKDSNDDWEDISRKFHGVICYSTASFEGNFRKIQQSDLLQETYNELIDLVNKGDFRSIFIGDGDVCYITSQNIRYILKDWKVNAGLYNRHDRENLLPPIIPDKPCVKINTIKLETGNLLIADWFRIEEFTKTVDDNTNNICHINGRENEQKRFAEEFNFFSVNVGNSSPTIYEQDGTMAFGYINDEKFESYDEYKLVENQYNDLGSVCTNLWNVTVIEKENLIKIIASKIGYEEAVKEVDEYLKENDVKILKVEPGEYYCYSCGNNFKKHIAEYDTPGDMITDPLFVLSDRLLELKNDMDISLR